MTGHEAAAERARQERDDFLRGVVAELQDGNDRWPGLWTRLDSLLRERDALAAALERQQQDAEELREALAHVMKDYNVPNGALTREQSAALAGQQASGETE